MQWTFDSLALMQLLRMDVRFPVRSFFLRLSQMLWEFRVPQVLHPFLEYDSTSLILDGGCPSLEGFSKVYSLWVGVYNTQKALLMCAKDNILRIVPMQCQKVVGIANKKWCHVTNFRAASHPSRVTFNIEFCTKCASRVTFNIKLFSQPV